MMKKNNYGTKDQDQDQFQKYVHNDSYQIAGVPIKGVYVKIKKIKGLKLL